MAFCVYTGKKGSTKKSCHKKKTTAKKAAAAVRARGGHARVRKVKSR
jgi:hypothetical protein